MHQGTEWKKLTRVIPIFFNLHSYFPGDTINQQNMETVKSALLMASKSRNINGKLKKESNLLAIVDMVMAVVEALGVVEIVVDVVLIHETCQNTMFQVSRIWTFSK